MSHVSHGMINIFISIFDELECLRFNVLILVLFHAYISQ